MNKPLALGFSAIIALVSACSREPEFHYGFPSTHPKIIIQDDEGKIIPKGQIILTTNYWYPSLLGRPKGKQFIEKFPISSDGVSTLTLRQHHQITKQELVIETEGAIIIRTRIDDDLDWASFETRPRKIAVINKGALSPTTKYWRGINAYEAKRYDVPLSGLPLEFSFETGEFMDSGGDLLFIVDRPVSTDREKEDKPVRLTLKSTNGSIQKMSQHEVIFALDGAISRWGDTDSIQLEARNSRSHPALKCSLAYSSSDGRTRALISLWAHPVSDDPDGNPIMAVSLWTKVDHYNGE